MLSYITHNAMFSSDRAVTGFPHCLITTKRERCSGALVFNLSNTLLVHSAKTGSASEAHAQHLVDLELASMHSGTLESSICSDISTASLHAR